MAWAAGGKELLSPHFPQFQVLLRLIVGTFDFDADRMFGLDGAYFFLHAGYRRRVFADSAVLAGGAVHVFHSPQNLF